MINEFEKVTWATVKGLIDSGAQYRYVQRDNNYVILAKDGWFSLYCTISLSAAEDAADKTDFDTNYKAGATNSGLEISVSVDASIPSISSKLRSDGEFSETTITADGPSWQTAYLYNGSGLLFDFFMDFNSSDVNIRLSVDSEVIFTYTVDEIDNIKVDDRKSPTWLSEDSSNKITFNPRWPIKYNSQVKIEVHNTKNSNKKIERRVVTLTKET